MSLDDYLLSRLPPGVLRLDVPNDGYGEEKKKMSDTEHITQKGVLDRGWTKGLIKRFLGEPDKQAPNPIYRTAGMVKLYDLERIKAAEASKAFKEAQAKAKARGAKTSARMTAKYEQLRNELTKKARSFEIEIEVYPKKDVLKSAIKHYNSFRSYRRTPLGWGFTATEDEEPCSWAGKHSDEAFLQRIQVNYIRHNLTNYEFLLACLAEPLGANKAKWTKTAGEAAYIVMSNILDAIAQRYPYLKEECTRQKNRALAPVEWS